MKYLIDKENYSKDKDKVIKLVGQVNSNCSCVLKKHNAEEYVVELWSIDPRRPLARSGPYKLTSDTFEHAKAVLTTGLYQIQHNTYVGSLIIDEFPRR